MSYAFLIGQPCQTGFHIPVVLTQDGNEIEKFVITHDELFGVSAVDPSLDSEYEARRELAWIVSQNVYQTVDEIRNANPTTDSIG